MLLNNVSGILIENKIVRSEFLRRNVLVDFYIPQNLINGQRINLLLINDGQNMKELGLKKILEKFFFENHTTPILCAAIHASENRKMEYGTAHTIDYLGRGEKAGLYSSFIMKELLPDIYKNFGVYSIQDKFFAGFSLGGLMALDIVWNHTLEFSGAGIFSGSLWWRSIDQHDEDYDDNLHRIMHQQIKKGIYHPNLKLFFSTGSLDETKDRNQNGIIDSIDDTISLIKELEQLGYENGKNIRYINYTDGKHDIATWARAMPEFLKWNFGNQ